MYSVTHDDGDKPTRFHYNGYLTGDVIINVEPDTLQEVFDPGVERTVMQVRVPGENLRALVLDVLRDELTARLQDMDTAELARFFAGTALQ